MFAGMAGASEPAKGPFLRKRGPEIGGWSQKGEAINPRMDLQEEAGLERELEAKQELCKQLQSLFQDPGSSLHLPSQGEGSSPHPSRPAPGSSSVHTDRE